ncbi:AAA family ATPase [Methylomagnum sp.]
MKLKRIVLDNFRCFEHLEMEFDNRLTVLVGGNGRGKTAVLDGILLLFKKFLEQLPIAKAGYKRASIADIRIDPVTNKPFPALCFYGIADIETELNILKRGSSDNGYDPQIEWSGHLLRDTSKTTKEHAKSIKKQGAFAAASSLLEIKKFSDQLIDAENQDKTYQMPVMAYYGTNRAVFETSLTPYESKEFFTRFHSLSNALNPAVNFKTAFAWFHAKENEEARGIKANKSLDYSDASLDCVRRAITRVFPEFKNPRTELDPLRFMVDWKDGDHYIPLDLKQLSDGYRTTLALVTDIARRMVEANPPGSGINDPLNTEAIVLIDEVDLHLHPEWQQRILKQLLETFPKSQFIVTTHSPQVLSTVPAECIRIIHDGRVFGATPGTEGAESARVLKQIFGVESRPLENEFTRKLFRYRDLVYDNQWESIEAVGLRKKLDAHFRQNEPLLLELDLYIENRQWELAE